LSFHIKYPNKSGKKCYLCRENSETLEHLFDGYRLTTDFFKNVQILLGKKDLILHLDLIYTSLDERGVDESVIIAILKLCVWIKRNYLTKKEVSDVL